MKNLLQDYTVSITCTDQLSPTGGSFDLRFSRTFPDAETSGPIRSPSHKGKERERKDKDSFNPHDDAEPFLRNVLRHGHGRLAPSLNQLVGILRDTLPIVVELEGIRQTGDAVGVGMVDTFAKSAEWYRLLYGDLR